MFSFEKEFVDKIIAKDHATFDLFYLKAIDIFYRYVKSHYNLPEQEIQDILSDVFCRIWISLDKYNPEYWFDRYVWTILKNRIKDHFKKSKAQTFSSYNEKNQVAVEEFLVSDDDVVSTFEQNFMWEDIDRAMKDFDQFSQDLLFWRFTEQKSYEEISALTWVSTQNLRKRISRLVADLRNNIEKS